MEFDRLITAWHRSNEMSMRLDSSRRRPVLATAVVATVADPKVFRSGRNFSAWIGLVPKRTPAVASSSAASANKVTAICAACRGWRAGRHSLCQDPWHQTSALAHSLLARRRRDRRHRARHKIAHSGHDAKRAIQTHRTAYRATPYSHTTPHPINTHSIHSHSPPLPLIPLPHPTPHLLERGYLIFARTSSGWKSIGRSAHIF